RTTAGFGRIALEALSRAASNIGSRRMIRCKRDFSSFHQLSFLFDPVDSFYTAGHMRMRDSAYCGLDRQLSGSRPLEYSADIGADQMIRIGVAGSVAHEAAHHRELAHKVHCRQRVASRQCNELIASADEKRIISNQK